MVKIKAPKSWAEQIADPSDSVPKDFDPEENGEHYEEEEDELDSASSDGGVATAREHYLDVGKSKLRKPKETFLGPRYTGSTTSRDHLNDDESDDDPFRKGFSGDEESDEEIGEQEADENEEMESEEAFENGDDDRPKFSASKQSMKMGTKLDIQSLQKEETVDGSNSGEEHPEALGNGISGDSDAFEDTSDDDPKDVDMEGMDDMSEGDSDGSSVNGQQKKPELDDRAELRKMMAEEQKTIISTISKATKADIAKGKAVKHQRSTFDSLLNTRIRLQKALIATNSLAADVPSVENKADKDAVKAAEKAALSLWNAVDDLRQSLQSGPAEEHLKSKKRPFSATPSTATDTLWARMQYHESSSLPYRRATLSKWSSRVRLSSTLQTRNALSAAPTHQPLASVLDQQLSAPNNARLIARTRIPRSCAPVQAAKKIAEDKIIYDDADFYTLLLRELVDQRMSSSTTNPINSTGTNPSTAPAIPLKIPKIRRQVDTKASKGRKMRYTVHEKLENFMAPDNRGGWGERQVGELFGSLFGAKVALGEEGSDGEEGGREEDGLRLFGGR